MQLGKMREKWSKTTSLLPYGERVDGERGRHQDHLDPAALEQLPTDREQEIVVAASLVDLVYHDVRHLSNTMDAKHQPDTAQSQHSHSTVTAQSQHSHSTMCNTCRIRRIVVPMRHCIVMQYHCNSDAMSL